MDPFLPYRRNSKGPCNDSPAKVHPKIMFGPGFYLNESFIDHHNITHVINCADESAVSTDIKNQLSGKYICLNAIDSFNVSIIDWYPAFEQFMNKFLRDQESKVIYVNCQMGMNRSGFLTALYICLKFNYPYDKVTKAILLQRPCALANPVFHQQVQDYIKKHR
jgi:hypothetical protein